MSIFELEVDLDHTLGNIESVQSGAIDKGDLGLCVTLVVLVLHSFFMEKRRI